jgi:ABC-type phosphate transport system substrate-binding protein
VPMTTSEQAAAKGGPITQVPVALGGEGVVYNMNLPAGARLHLTGPVLASIFLGQITSWNDPAISASTPASPCPARGSPSSTAPTAVAPPTSSAATSPATIQPGPPKSAPARPSTGRSGKAPKAMPASPPRCSG